MDIHELIKDVKGKYPDARNVYFIYNLEQDLENPEEDLLDKIQLACFQTQATLICAASTEEASWYLNQIHLKSCHQKD